MRSNSEKYRLLLSRVAAVIVLFFLCTTRSYWEANSPLVASLLFLLGTALVGVASLGRMWCSLYIAGYKDRKLITEGPYSICRNPLYFFTMIGGVGIGCATQTLTFPIVFLALFAIYYPFVIKGEENRLKQLFGTEFDAYTTRVPAFFPRLAVFSEPASYSVNPAVYRKHIFDAVWFIWIVGLVAGLEGIRKTGLLVNLWSVY